MLKFYRLCFFLTTSERVKLPEAMLTIAYSPTMTGLSELFHKNDSGASTAQKLMGEEKTGRFLTFFAP
jgi:hypothetical protein